MARQRFLKVLFAQAGLFAACGIVAGVLGGAAQAASTSPSQDNTLLDTLHDKGPVGTGQAGTLQIDRKSGIIQSWGWQCNFNSATSKPFVCGVTQNFQMNDVQHHIVSLIGSMQVIRAVPPNGTVRLSDAPYRIIVRVPLGLSLSKHSFLGVDNAAPVPLEWDYCDNRGCVAQATFTLELMDALRRGSTGHLMLAKRGAGVLTINFPLGGLGPALDTADGWASKGEVSP
ncbi:hypothetical protein CSR02_05945 [Acetobacter pomorum]|uniref:Invasion associated locus B family protein n=1 Tax=Acetobacter pomorum TaxID=65959 RepID=A0A2G4RCC3_9PROT|nr:invasion associated locus B family protein [Acetobacter pomorum]PHY94208.1 hypothetical protein CSR02_05945 [Acetobacter pomorum]GBR52391.1 hypothetical protein AA11825_2225 [Acetobacter pomorum DSM 11825]